jgi:hypothetical protein
MTTKQCPAWPPPSPETAKSTSSPPNQLTLSTGTASDIPMPAFNSRFSQQRYGEFPTINNVACRQQPTVVLKPRNPVHQVCTPNAFLFCNWLFFLAYFLLKVMTCINFFFRAGRLCQYTCSATGAGLVSCIHGVTTTITLTVRNHAHQPVERPLKEIDAVLNDDLNAGHVHIIQAGQPGTYTISYTGLAAGMHRMTIRVRDGTVVGSPFRISSRV